MKPCAVFLSGILVCLALSNCQAPLISNQSASLRFSLTMPVIAASPVATSSGARLIDPNTYKIQIIIKDPAGATSYQKTVSRNSQGIYQFDGLPSGKGFSVTINALNVDDTVLTTATRSNVDLIAGKVNSITAFLMPDTSLIMPINYTGQIQPGIKNTQYAIWFYQSSANSTFLNIQMSGNYLDNTKIKLTVVDSNGAIIIPTHPDSTNWVINLPIGTYFYLVVQANSSNTNLSDPSLIINFS